MSNKIDYISTCSACYDNKLVWDMNKGDYNINTLEDFKMFCYDKIKKDFNNVYKIEDTEESLKIYFEEQEDDSPFVPDIEVIPSEDGIGFYLNIFTITWYDAESVISIFKDL